MIRHKPRFMNNTSIRFLFLIPVLAASFLVFNPAESEGQQKPQNLDRIVAVVNDNIILKSDVDQRVAQFLQSQRKQKGTSAPPFSKDLWYNALETVIDQYVLLENARMDSVNVTSEQVSRAMQRRMDQLVKQAGSKDKLEQAFGKSLVQIKAEFRQQFREDMVIRRYRTQRMDEISITRPEVRKFYNSIPKDSLPQIPEQVALSQIVRIPPPLSDAKDNARKLAKTLRDSLINHDADFEDLARRWSDGPSAQKGGQLPMMPMSELVPAYATAASNLEEGKISGIVETSYGYHIIRLNKRVGKRISTNHILISVDENQVDKQAAKEFLSAVRDSVLDHGKSFSKMAQKYSDDKNTASVGGKIFNPESSGRLLSVNQLDPALQRITYLLQEEGDISEPKSFTPDKQNAQTAFRIVRLDERIPEHTANLKQDYDRIQQIALRRKQAETMQDWLDELRKNVYVKYHVTKPDTIEGLDKKRPMPKKPAQGQSTGRNRGNSQ